MFSRPQQCGRCRLSYFSTGYVPDSKATSNKKIAIVTNSPDKGSIQSGYPWGSNQGYFWRDVLLSHVGLKAEDVLFSHVLRCFPGDYPTGPLAVHATEVCRQYDQELIEFAPTIVVCTESPKKLIDNPALFRLIRADTKKAYEFYQMGYRPLVCMGLEAVRLVLPWIGSLKSWRGHWEEINGWPLVAGTQEVPTLIKVERKPLVSNIVRGVKKRKKG